MYINWVFEYVPKIFFVLSLTFNFIFIYLNISDSKKVLGKYRFVLLAFSIFNSVYSIVEITMPIASFGRDMLVLVYLPGGPFEESETFGQLAVSIRCGFISLSYGILTIHFIYRYFALFNPQMNDTMTSKHGIAGLSIFFIMHGVLWSGVCETLVYATDEGRDRVREFFIARYNADISKISFINIFWWSQDPYAMYRSWLAILVVTTISACSISTYCILGYKIVNKLRSVETISHQTRKLHRQLFKTLVIQTLIPIFISFLPCFINWFLPLFGIDIWNWGNFGIVALSAFPFLDAVAIMILLPVYRNRFRLRKGSLETSFKISTFSK
ncbi:unnamed protein product [Caenorhabditis angaria]|uniref:Uncharacterized protein n=1 Tax=Caenorhabditis angaria TaxID=860376 RepID=A0A9P1J0I5_9PELO|nr:unnamed protein product [Caenorhabditis angaria]